MAEDGGPNRGPIAALIVVVVLVVAGLWLTGHLRTDSTIQDCVMSGRSNCAPLSVPKQG